jgi:hypothetical protein
MVLISIGRFAIGDCSAVIGERTIAEELSVYLGSLYLFPLVAGGIKRLLANGAAEVSVKRRL